MSMAKRRMAESHTKYWISIKKNHSSSVTTLDLTYTWGFTDKNRDGSRKKNTPDFLLFKISWLTCLFIEEMWLIIET